MKLSNTAVMLFLFSGVGAFAVFSVLRSGGPIANDYCAARLSEPQIRSIVYSEMRTRHIVLSSKSAAQLDNEKLGKLEIQVNPDWNANAGDEYSASMYRIQFSEGDLRFWALLSSCGRVNMAGSGEFSR